MKKSMEEAMIRAQAHSEKFPDIAVYVMDKKYKDSVVCASDWVHRERILAGWNDVAKFYDGKQIW